MNLPHQDALQVKGRVECFSCILQSRRARLKVLGAGQDEPFLFSTDGRRPLSFKELKA